MSILSNVLNGKESVTQGFADAFKWLGAQFDSIRAASPQVAAAVTDVETAARNVEQVAADWIDTAIGPVLANYADEAANLIAKYAPLLVGSALGGAITPAGAVALQALASAGAAVAQHEVAQFMATQAPKAAVVAQAVALTGTGNISVGG